MPTRCVASGLAVLAVVLGGVETASADSILTGQTSQRLPVRVGLAANGGVEHVKITWRARCNHGVPTLQNKTITRVVDPEPVSFFGSGHYTLSRGGNKYAIRGRLDASPGTTPEDQAANQVRWNGSFKVKAKVRHGGRTIAKCHKGVTWTAAGPKPVAG